MAIIYIIVYLVTVKKVQKNYHRDPGLIELLPLGLVRHSLHHLDPLGIRRFSKLFNMLYNNFEVL